MTMRFAFAGFRHDHIFSLYNKVKERPDTELVGACEEDDATREALAQSGRAEITHPSLAAMLEDVDCDVVAIGDYYAQRGALALAALRRGKHVLADKPLCTDLDELAEIERLAEQNALKVGCMLGNRDRPQFRALRGHIRDGLLGELHAISFGGQHPLLLGKRPHWYFEQGKHGGTINDIAIHAIDLVPWLTGLRFARINAARAWNAFAPDYPHFKDAAQMMLTMDNGCGVLGDVSYMAPNSMGYATPFYWRWTFFGRNGIAEVSQKSDGIIVALDGKKELETLPATPGGTGDYLRAFLDDVAGTPQPDALDTATVIESSRTTLRIQKAADEGRHDLSLLG